jgi:hypothetical protein
VPELTRVQGGGGVVDPLDLHAKMLASERTLVNTYCVRPELTAVADALAEGPVAVPSSTGHGVGETAEVPVVVTVDLAFRWRSSRRDPDWA